MGCRCVIHVPDNAARVKVEALQAARRRGARAQISTIGGGSWRRARPATAGIFFHPVCEREVIAGAATIGAEIVEDLPEVEAVLIPIGGGGLACGIAQAVRMKRPGCRILAVETDTAMPLKAALEAGEPVTVPRDAELRRRDRQHPRARRDVAVARAADRRGRRGQPRRGRGRDPPPRRRASRHRRRRRRGGGRGGGEGRDRRARSRSSRAGISTRPSWCGSCRAERLRAPDTRPRIHPLSRWRGSPPAGPSRAWRTFPRPAAERCTGFCRP